MIPMSCAKQKTARLLLGIVNATVKRSINACAIGGKQTESDLVKCPENGATENWQTQVLRKKQSSALLKPKGQKTAKIGVGTKYLPLMADTDVPAAAKLNACFCQ